MRSEPLQITAGDSVTWDRYQANYSAADGWALHYYFVNSTNAFDFQSQAFGEAHRVEIDAATSAAFTPGRYKFQVKAVKGLEVVTVESGNELDVLPNFASGPLDGRTQTEVALDAVRATIAKKATKDQLSITVEGRTIQRMSFEDLIKAEKHLVAQVAREQRASKGQRPGGVRKIHARFTR